MSLLRYFIFILIVISSNKSYSQKNASNKIPGNVFSTFKTTNHIFNETTLESIYFTCLVPKKIVLEEAEKFYSNLGSFEKEKKIFNSTIQTKGEMLSVKLSIEKKDKRIFFYVAQKKELSEENSIKNLQESFKKILMRRFLNDYIKELELSIKKTDKKQNRIIRNNPNNLLMNSGLFYKFYQKKESKKIALKSALESLYEELEETKANYNSIN
tara:strand:+ start:5798 stop:6436 length:639 start_codon:yes stop_codon:yes gene_type:complete